MSRMAAKRQTGVTARLCARAALTLGLVLLPAMSHAGSEEPAIGDPLVLPQDEQESSDFTLNLSATEWNDGSSFWRLPERGAGAGFGAFTPRLGTLPVGPSYLPSAGLGAQPLDGQADGRDEGDFALSLSLSDTIGPVNVGLGGGVISARLADADDGTALGGASDDELRSYGINLNLGYGGFAVSGAYAREASGGLVDGDVWDAGVAYDTGSWAFGLNYLYSEFEASSPALQAEDEVQAISGEVSYSIGPGFSARAALSHAQWEDSSGERTRGTLGILGLRYNF